MEKGEIKYVDIVFESCEVARLTPKMFRGLIVDGITKNYWINCFQYEKGEVRGGLDCNLFIIRINKNGMELKPFKYDKKRTLRDRMEHDDITHIDLFFKNGKREYIAVPWSGEGYTNKKQKTKVHKESIEIIIK